MRYYKATLYPDFGNSITNSKGKYYYVLGFIIFYISMELWFVDHFSIVKMKGIKKRYIVNVIIQV